MKLFFTFLLAFIAFLVVMLYFSQDNVGTKMLPNGKEVIDSLVKFKAEEKFREDSLILYFGAPDETTRLRAQGIINSSITQLINTTDKQISEVEFWEILKQAATQLKLMDSEEMERGLTYMENLMDIYGIESSGGRLNEWRYGFEPPT